MNKDYANLEETKFSYKTKKCRNCGSGFKGANGWIFCCSWCRIDYYDKKRITDRAIKYNKNTRKKKDSTSSVKKIKVDTPWRYEIRLCSVCRKEFNPNTKNQKYCSKECGRISQDFVYRMNNKLDDDRGGWFKLRFEIFKRDNFTCQYCGRNVKDDYIKLHCDHINPRKNNGLDTPENLVTSCLECNLGKSDVLLNKKNIKNKLKLISNARK